MIDVRGNDRTACGDLGADEFSRDLRRDALWEAAEDRRGVGALWTLSRSGVLLIEFVADDVLVEFSKFGLLRPTHVLADGNKLHLRGDDSLTRIPELGHGMTGRSAERLTFVSLEPRKFYQAVSLGVAGELGMLA